MSEADVQTQARILGSGVLGVGVRVGQSVTLPARTLRSVDE